jgi:agmatine deiminase
VILTSQNNIAFLSHILPKGLHKSVARAAKTTGTCVGILRGTRDIWCRDFMPIQIGVGQFVQFRYLPDYLDGHEGMITSPEVARAALPAGSRCVRSSVVLDGGNVVNWTSKAILTDKIYKENPRFSRAGLRRRIQGLLEVNELIVIPKEPHDVIGHADGVVRFVDERTVLVNDYSKVDPGYGASLEAVLRRHGLDWIKMPYCPSGKVIDGIPSAEGNYINFLQVGRLIVAPVYRKKRTDGRALRTLERAFPDSRIVPLDCRELARQGGVLNCISWTIKV